MPPFLDLPLATTIVTRPSALFQDVTDEETTNPLKYAEGYVFSCNAIHNQLLVIRRNFMLDPSVRDGVVAISTAATPQTKRHSPVLPFSVQWPQVGQAGTKVDGGPNGGDNRHETANRCFVGS